VEIVAVLVLFPLMAAGLLLVVTNDRARGIIVAVSAAVIAIGSIVLAAFHLGGQSVYSSFNSEAISVIALVVDVAMGVLIFVMGIRAKKYLACVLVAVQTPLVAWFELGPARSIDVTYGIYIDRLSVIMALIIGVIGSGICRPENASRRIFWGHRGLFPPGLNERSVG